MPDWRADAEAVAAILGARHGDPFAVLGPHQVAGQRVLRAFVPGAETLHAGTVALERRDDAGFFEGLIPPGDYALHATHGASAWTLEDPYRFGPTLGPLDDHLLVEGTHALLPDRLGAHPCVHEGVAGVRFAVWAPNARRVSVVGAFNGWDGRRHAMRKRVDSGLWEIFLPGLGLGDAYKYEILGADGLVQPLKADPYGFAAELRPANAGIVAAPTHEWGDAAWMAARAAAPARARPMAIYEVHAPSWRRHPDGRCYTWDELAAALIPYVLDLGFTHIELMPVMEHPLDASWGYQPVGLHAVTARMGEPAGLMRLVDAAHQAGIGVILDWVPAHFPRDAHGLARFDGATLYEHPDPKRGYHATWQTAIFDYGRREVAAFLAANALFWLRRYHADGLRVDAVSAMVQLDHARGPDEWSPNPDGSTENHDAIGFLRQVNALVAAEAPGALMVAEEATDFPNVTRDRGGLGFGFKWNMGWMNDTLCYLEMDPLFRQWHHKLMNFGLMYAFSEDFILPLSHDEVVHGKGTLLGRISGDDWQRFATLRAYYGFMWGHPGKKLLFMGQEFAPWREWTEERELDWWLLAHPPHQAMQQLVRDLNRLHRSMPALHARDCDAEGFRWLDADDAERSLFSWLRLDGEGGPPVAVLCNFTPVPRHDVLVGLPFAGRWAEALNTDAACYGGSNLGNMGGVVAEPVPAQGQPASARVTVPPLATLYLVRQAQIGQAAARGTTA
jgi:1,4-alpha-glucan branching enzyme